MNKRIFWTTAALVTAALGTPFASHAELSKAVDSSKANRQAMSPDSVSPAQSTEVVKVGEYQSPVGTKANDTVIARIQPHQLAGRKAATLYVRNIPVLTFLGSNLVATSSTKVGAADDSQEKRDPVWRATAVAARLNQLSRDNVDASKITAVWQAGEESHIASKEAKETQNNSDRYLIKINGEKLVEIDAETRLADTTNDLAKDALQVTNRLRRLLGNAPPLREISGRPVVVKVKLPQAVSLKNLPKVPKQIALGPVRISLNGLASWYGPGFHGNRTANGEVYDQNALTAAHRSLPFGTMVRVTHMGSGRSVVVRITDRGPYAAGRIIDLSAAAARIVGVMQSGVAPVRVEVVDR